jgi:two-component SAPR family response regulator
MEGLHTQTASGQSDHIRTSSPSFRYCRPIETDRLNLGVTPIGLQRRTTPQTTQEIRIYTLGRFSLLKQHGEVRISGKGQRKSLELLKTVIALGGREIGETRINEALWPDSEGDVAHTAFAVTLHRLRKLIGAKALVLIDGRLTLNADYCWVDAWQCERLMGEIKSAVHQAHTDHNTVLDKISALLSFYHGPYLGNEDEQAWFLSYRARLHSKFQRCLITACRYLEAHKQGNAAIELYEQCLQIDDLFEQAYTRLMHCYLNQGRQVEALMTYQRCQDVMGAHLGVSPSNEMQRLYKTMQQCA